MKGRWVLLGVAIGIVVSLTFGFVWTTGGSTRAPSGAQGGMSSACAAMHESAAMEQMHAQMPAEVRAQCDSMHAQMAGMMGGSGMMGSGMMGGATGSGMMTGSMAAHHG